MVLTKRSAASGDENEDGPMGRFLCLQPLCVFLRLVFISNTQFLRMTSAQVVETSVPNNSSFQNFSDFSHSDDHTELTTDTLEFKNHFIFPILKEVV